MKLGSLFDGSGGFPLAGAINGIEPVWASEIEPFPIKVTKTRFPHMVHLGDVTKIDGAAIEKVDVITFGSPCQDLSVAGAQKGIHEGARSSLFFEAVRIIKEMRDSDRATGRTDQHIRPRFAVWENVPGAFSSNGGADFQAVLQALAEIADPGAFIPRHAKWNKPGCIVGDGWSIAWRIMDAQHWGKTVYDRDDGNVLSHGTPQRRRRIYLVADFASERAGEILFERESVSGDFEQGAETREGAAADAEGSVGGGGRVRSLNQWDSQTIRQYDADGVFPALTSNNGGDQNRQGCVYPVIARTLTAEHDASPCVDRGQNVVAAFMGGQGAKARSIAYCDDGTVPTLRAAPSGGNTVPDVVTAIEGNTIDRNSNKNGCGYCLNIAPTMNTQDRHGVVYGFDMQAIGTYGDGKTASTLKQRDYKDATDLVVKDGRVYPGVGITSKQTPANPQFGDHAPTLNTDNRNYLVMTTHPPRKYIVRRLTPLECCRLQGFPDWWVGGCEKYPITGWWARGGYWTQIIDPRPSVAGFDSAIYKMWGNGIALPCAEFVMRRIVKYA